MTCQCVPPRVVDVWSALDGFVVFDCACGDFRYETLPHCWGALPFWSLVPVF